MKRKSFLKPLEDRVFVYKKATKKFFCPLCRTQRNFTSTPRLTLTHYLQIAMTTLILVMVLFPFVAWKGLFTIFLVWMGFYFMVRMNFKKQIPCEHCGFDATWYHRDIPTTRKKVAEFWEKNEALKVSTTEEQSVVVDDLAPQFESVPEYDSTNENLL